VNWRATGILFAFAAILFAFIFFFERLPDSKSAHATTRLAAVAPNEITAIQLKRTNQLMLRVERTNGTWSLTVPVSYPAQPFAVEGLLQRLAELQSTTFISLKEIKSNGRTLADFGLEMPSATLSLLSPNQRVELLFGSKTPPGDGVYVQVPDADGIYVVDAEVYDRLPRGFDEWRDTALISAAMTKQAGAVWNRMEVRTAGRGFAIQADAADGVLYLSKPTPARADPARLEALLRRVLTAQVVRFENDNPRADPEPYGLQSPEAELVFGLGTNDVFVVQFGKSPTNDSTTVYARRLSHTNIVLVARGVLDALQTSHSDLRDLRLLSFKPAQVDELEIVGPENFTVQRQTNGTWIINSSPPQSADANLIRATLERLAHLEGTVEKDIVTDFAIYGLAAPTRQFVLKAAMTNATGGILSNRVVAQLDLGGRQGGQFFARSKYQDENSVYTVPAADCDRLPIAAWQLRDRRLWNFTTNQVARVMIRQHGYTRQFNRGPNGEWTLAPGSTGIINTFGVEECVFRLGQLRATAWVDRGEEKRDRYGITDLSQKITIELKIGDKPQILSVEFGGAAPSKYPYAITTVDGQALIFEFPWDLFSYLQPYLTNAPLPPK